MNMTHPIFDRFYKIGVIPVLEIDSAQQAKPLAESLLAGELPVAEITLRTVAALESIQSHCQRGKGCDRRGRDCP